MIADTQHLKMKNLLFNVRYFLQVIQKAIELLGNCRGGVSPTGTWIWEWGDVLMERTRQDTYGCMLFYNIQPCLVVCVPSIHLPIPRFKCLWYHQVSFLSTLHSGQHCRTAHVQLHVPHGHSGRSSVNTCKLCDLSRVRSLNTKTCRYFYLK